MTATPMLASEDLLQRLETAQVVVIGDLMLDRAVFGRVGRISPEAPIPVLEMVREETRIGGAGNVVANLHALGAQVSAAGMVGDDPEGEEIAGLMAELAPSGAILWRQEGRPSTVKTRYWGAGQQLLRVDREHRSTLSEAGVASILDWLDELAGPERAMVPREGVVRRRALKTCALATGLADKAVSLFYEGALHERASAVWVERCRRQIASVLGVLEEERGHGRSLFWHGDRIGHADIAVACALRFLTDAHRDVVLDGPWPNLAAHAAQCEAMPVFQEIAQAFSPPA